MKKVMWSISFVSLVLSAIALQFMPENVPLQYDITGNIDRWGSKYEYLLFPMLLLVMSFIWTLLLRYYEKKAQKADEKESVSIKTNANVIGIVGIAAAAILTILQGFLLYSSYHDAISGATKQTIDIGKVAVLLIGGLSIVIGNIMTKTRINKMVGVRIRWSMYNDNTWRRTNRFGAFAMIIAGILTIILAVGMKNSFGATMAAVGIILLAGIVTVIYAHRVYVQEINAGKEQSDETR